MARKSRSGVFAEELEGAFFVIVRQDLTSPGRDVDIIVAEEASIETLMTLGVFSIANQIARASSRLASDAEDVDRSSGAHRHVVQPVGARGAERGLEIC